MREINKCYSKWTSKKLYETNFRKVSNITRQQVPLLGHGHVYKLFSKVTTYRLAPAEQTGFQKGISSVDHIHTLWQVIQKTEKYNLPLFSICGCDL